MKVLKSIFLGVVSLLFLTIGFISCSNDDEDYVFPSLLSEFADISTDADGRFDYLLTDEGKKLEIVNSAEIEIEGVTPDTVYRTLSRYELMDRGVRLYSLQAIPLLYPKPQNAFPGGVKTDPLTLQSLWRGGDYLNMIVQVKAQNGKHVFYVVEDSLTTSPTGGRTLFLRLCHDAGDDVQAYTQKAYFSIPLSPYASSMSSGDVIVMDIPTETGWQRWTREF